MHFHGNSFLLLFRRGHVGVNYQPKSASFVGKMTVTLYNLYEAGLLCVNGVAVLHEERFLAKIGWGGDQVRGFGEDPGMKSQLINLVKSVRTVMRVPLIFLNIATIVFKLIFG